MTSDAHGPANALRRMVADGRLTEHALQAMTGIAPEALRSILEDDAAAPGFTSRPSALSVDETVRLSILEAQLSDGLRIGDDERLTGIFESLTIECHLAPLQIARLTGLRIDDVERVVRDPQTVPMERRAGLALRGSYLINAINQARGH